MILCAGFLCLGFVIGMIYGVWPKVLPPEAPKEESPAPPRNRIDILA